jgi:IS5 family transposase
LPQRLEHATIELRHLVEKQHAVMREADFSWPRRAAAADERDVRDGVMRRAKRALGQQPDAGRS